jgi:hypothetical protein
MKVYLSKSNSADIDVYRSVQAKIRELGHEIMEFTGGVYEPDSILLADCMVVVPPQSIIGSPEDEDKESSFTFEYDSFSLNYSLGRGQSEQILYWMKHKHKNCEPNAPFPEIPKIYVIVEVHNRPSRNHVFLSTIKTMYLSKADWRENWSELRLTHDQRSLIGYIGTGKSIIDESGSMKPSVSSNKIVPYLACRNLFK